MVLVRIVFGRQLKLHGSFWSWISNLNLNSIGYGIVIVFVVTWLVAWGIWKVARVEDRWSADIQPVPAELPSET